MANILVLDNDTINQIAAGEVVERPASIIKELVENSIDAESSAITIEIHGGGISLIRVTDNGKGMDAQDALLSFERHATSKISASPDLDKISTLGFRGEALASIAAVTRMEMITRTRGSLSGIQIVNQGGSILSQNEIGCPEGTTIITQDLFFNTPARLKFLKIPRAETAHISDLIGRLILAHPEISFKYINGGKMVYYSPGDGNLLTAILSIYGRDVTNQLLEIKTTDNEKNIKLSGYLGKPSLSRKNRNHQSFFVNGRYIKSSLLFGCIEAAFKPYLTINQFPWIVLHLNLPPYMVDVNVHPAKTEVRFREEEFISQFIQEHIEQVLKANPYIPRIREKSFISPLPEKSVSADTEQLEVFSSISTLPYDSLPDNSDSNCTKIQENRKNVYIAPSNDITPNKNQNIQDFSMNKDLFVHNNDISSISLKVTGKIFSTYIIVEGDEQIFFIDQHAAHERLLFEEYKQMVTNQKIVSQQLLPPIVMELTHAEQIMVNESMDLFSSLGFEMEPFGGMAFAIRGVPVILGSSNVHDFFQELLDGLKSFTSDSSYQLKLDDIIKMACKKAVKARDSLSEQEAAALIGQLLHNKIPMTCPHGRPIMISITRYELEKMFKRVQ